MSADIVRFTGPKLFSNATFVVPCDRDIIGLTIDDGPDPNSNRLILDVLREHGVTETFFVVGERGEKHKELLELITQEGHELANHTYTETVTIALKEVELKKPLRMRTTFYLNFKQSVGFAQVLLFITVIY